MEATAAAAQTLPLRAVVTGEVLALMGRNRTSQAKLAKHLNLSQPSLSKRLHGIVPWSVDEIEQVADFYGVSIALLVSPIIRWSTRAPSLTCENDVLGQMELAFVSEPALSLVSS